MTGKKPCKTPVNCGEDMDQSADLFGNMDDPRSPGNSSLFNAQQGLWGIVHSGNLKYAIRSILPLNVTVINMCEKLWDWIDTSGKEIDQRRKDLVLCVRAVKTLNEEFC